MEKLKALFAVLFALLASGCGGAYVSDNRIDIVCSSFPSYDFARNIAGDKARVTLLLPPGADSHSYDPKPADIIAVQNADLFICGGGESDEWVKRILGSVDFPEEKILKMTDCVEAVEEEHDHEHNHSHSHEHEIDEHVWTSPENAAKICAEIRDVLCAADSGNNEYYTENYSVYEAQLRGLDAELRQIGENAVRHTLVFGDRFPFRYLTDAYGFEWEAAFPGCAEMTEPSAKTVCRLIDFVRSEDIPIVFYVEFSNHKICDTIAAETGAKPMLLHSAHNLTAQEFESGIGYIDIMKENIKAIREALCDGTN